MQECDEPIYGFIWKLVDKEVAAGERVGLHVTAPIAPLGRNIEEFGREGRSAVRGDRRPASTLIVGGLANPAWKIEVEGIAVG
jgi:hypothetical protein